MSPATPEAGFRPVGVLTLLGAKRRALLNHAATALADAPLRVLGTLAFLVLIWFGLYGLFWAVFDYLRSQELVSVVAIPLVFSFFFAALLILLTFSNAILAYATLFGRDEALYLLAAPVAPRAVVAVKYLEVLFFSSWSLVLLGLPLMLAIADITPNPQLFYPLFVAFFLFFVPIPGALGLALAWLTARYMPRRGRQAVVGVLVGVALAATVWGLRAVNRFETQNGDWLHGFLFRMEFLRSALLPSNWITHGIDHAMHHRFGESLSYLLLVLANALFLSWLAVRLTAARFATALDRALTGRGGPARLPTDAAGGVLGAVFAYLPPPLKLIAVKDLRTFLRDPLQWSQLVIFFGLMGLYLLNMPRFQVQMLSQRWALLVPVLNLSAVGFILAAFTSRFVYPLVSLEGHQFWLIGLLPMRRRRLLHAKFAFAMTVCVPVAVGAMALAAGVLQLAASWITVQLLITFSVCVGLCGLAVGLGARLPMFEQRHAARIAGGFGGTVNLIASVVLVSIALAGFGALNWRAYHLGLGAAPDLLTWVGVFLLTAVICVAGAGALHLGARHLDELEV